MRAAFQLTYEATHDGFVHPILENIHVTGITASKARASLYRLIDETANAHEPILITGKRHNAILVGEDDWQAIQETLYLLSVPGMRETIREGLAAPLAELTEELDR